MPGNLSPKCKDASLTEAMEARRGLGDVAWEPLAFARARSMARGVITKFQPCLPVAAEARLLAERLLDLPGALSDEQVRYAAADAEILLEIGDRLGSPATRQ